MNCGKFREKLAEYQFGLLAEQESAEMEAHLFGCPACRRELEAMERLDALLEPMQQHEAPANLWSGVRQRMEPRRAPWWQVARRPMVQVAAAAAVVLAIVVGGLSLGLRGGPVEPGVYGMLADEVQEHQLVAQWSMPLADDVALGAIYAGLDGTGELQ